MIRLDLQVFRADKGGDMPRRPKFKVTKDRDQWVVNVPASITASGKRERHYSPTFKKAQEEGQRLAAKYHSHGTQAAAIAPSLAEAAVHATERLKPYGMSLEAAINDYLTILDRRSHSVTLATASEAWLEFKSGLRSKTLSGYRETLRKLEVLEEELMADVTAEQVEQCLKGVSASSFAAHRRNARALFTWAAKRGWCELGIIQSIEQPVLPQRNEIETLSPHEARAILTAAEDYYPDAVPAFAIALFAGVRSAELHKLRWRDVKDDGIEISSETAKKKKRRFINFNPTLKAWLANATRPVEDTFLVTPSNWREKSKAVRRLARFDISARLLSKLKPKPKLKKPTRHWPQNALRHTHASAAIASGATITDLIFAFGHGQGEQLLREHYVGVYSKKDAIAFWSIGPKGTKIETTRAVA